MDRPFPHEKLGKVEEGENLYGDGVLINPPVLRFHFQGALERLDQVFGLPPALDPAIEIQIAGH